MIGLVESLPLLSTLCEDIVNLRKMKRDSQCQYVQLPSPENKKLFYDLCMKFNDLYVQKQEDFLEQCCEVIMKLHGTHYQF
jgi:hypothetical protein